MVLQVIAFKLQGNLPNRVLKVGTSVYLAKSYLVSCGSGKGSSRYFGKPRHGTSRYEMPRNTLYSVKYYLLKPVIQ